jgi:hypothetical protein
MIASAKSERGQERDAYAETDSAAPSDQGSGAAAHPLEPLLKQAAMLREFGLHYVEARKDSAKAAVRRLLIKAAVGVIAAIVGGTILIASSVMVADGLSELVSLAAGGRPWVGKLVVGVGVLVILSLVSWFYISRLLRAERERIIRKYESLHHAQREKFGSDVTQRAAL